MLNVSYYRGVRTQGKHFLCINLSCLVFTFELNLFESAKLNVFDLRCVVLRCVVLRCVVLRCDALWEIRPHFCKNEEKRRNTMMCEETREEERTGSVNLLMQEVIITC